MADKFIYEIKILSPFTVKEWGLINSEAKKNHDTKRWASQGGFIFGWMNRISWNEGQPSDITEGYLSHNDLDRIAKVIELSRSNHKLYARIYKMIRKIEEEGKRIQNS